MPATSAPRQIEEVFVDQVDDGYVVYDPALDRIHHLNHTAALVFELCTGENDRGTVAALVQKAFGLPEQPVDEVDACIDELVSQGLLN